MNHFFRASAFIVLILSAISCRDRSARHVKIPAQSLRLEQIYRGDLSIRYVDSPENIYIDLIDTTNSKIYLHKLQYVSDTSSTEYLWGEIVAEVKIGKIQINGKEYWLPFGMDVSAWSREKNCKMYLDPKLSMELASKDSLRTTMWISNAIGDLDSHYFSVYKKNNTFFSSKGVNDEGYCLDLISHKDSLWVRPHRLDKNTDTLYLKQNNNHPIKLNKVFKTRSTVLARRISLLKF